MMGRRAGLVLGYRAKAGCAQGANARHAGCCESELRLKGDQWNGHYAHGLSLPV